MTYNSPIIKRVFLGLALIVGLVFGCANCTHKNKIQYEAICDVENIDSLKLIGNNNHEFTGLNARKELKDTYSGMYAVQLGKGNKYGFGHTFYVKNNSTVIISTWRKTCNDCGSIAITSPDKKFKTVNSQKIVENKGDWQKVESRTVISVKGEEVIPVKTFYANQTQNISWLDDFHVQVFDEKTAPKEIDYPDFPELTQLNLQIKSKDLKKLKAYAAEAVKGGVILAKHKNKFKAVLLVNDKPYKVKIRFKGDWADHLSTKKWSFRVELKDDVSVLGGLKEFSLQNPETRHFAEEFFLHDLAQSLGLLATRYGFVQLSLNNENLGLYAYEEHFTKQLLESQKRREGIIMKFDEEPYWQYRRENSKRDSAVTLPSYAAASSQSFGSKKIVKTPGLSNQLAQANILMNQFKYSNISHNEIFDTKKLAMMLALCDYANISHTFIWHNLRLYYNPVISKLEPILFDAFQPFWPKSHESLLRLLQERTKWYFTQQSYMKFSWFTNHEIQEAYLESLRYLQSKEFALLENKSLNRTKYYVKIIQAEFLDYTFSSNVFKDNKAELRASYPSIDSLLKNVEINVIKKPFKHSYNETFKHYNLRAYIDTMGSNVITFENFHFQIADNIVLHFKKHKDILSHTVSSFNLDKTSPGVLEIKYPNTKKKLKSISYMVNGKKHEATIYPWAKQISEKTVLQQYKTSAKILLNHKIKNDTVWLSKGAHTLSETMTITEGKTLGIFAGTSIDITNNAKIICFGALSAIGTKDSPINIISSDKTGQGVVVLQAPSKSNLSYVTFDGLNTSLDRFWTLTGSVTFYESDVTMNHVTVKNNPCEDALNIIRSHFDINNLSVTGTASDGFDADYCTGIIDSSYFGDTGNDCIDVSTSEITISNITIKNSGDKGISGGEASTLHISNVSIDGAAIGIASKDKSELYLKNISISNAKYGLAAFQKKPEYGAANISAMQVTLNNVQKPFVLEKNSSIIWDGNINIGTKKLDVKQLYDL